MFKKESRFKNHDEVMEYLNETYYQGKVNNYEIKSMWKGNTLQYVTEFHTGVMEDKVWYIVTIYDNDLNKRKQPCSLLSEQVDIHDIIAEKLKDDLERLKTLHFSIASDVANPLFGPMGAAHVFGPQKGATPSMVEKLDQLAFDFAQQSAHFCGFDCSNKRGAGAAGGLGYAFMQFLHADCRLGIDLLLDTIDFDKQLGNTDMVITGEGSADAQTLMGKLPAGIMQRAKQYGVPTALIAGRIKDKEALLEAGFAQVSCINPSNLPLVEAMKKEVAEGDITQTVGLLV